MPNHDRAPDVELFEQLAQHGGLARGGYVVCVQSFAPAVARPVDQDDAMTHRESVAKCEPHVFEIAACAVDKQQRKVVGRGPFTAIELDHVQTSAGDLDEFSDRWIRALHPPCPDAGD